GFDEVQLALALLHELGRFHEPRIDALALDIDLVDVGLRVLAAPFLGLELAPLAVDPFASLFGSKRALRGSQPRKRDGTGQNAPQRRQPPHARYVLAQSAREAQSAVDAMRSRGATASDAQPPSRPSRPRGPTSQPPPQPSRPRNPVALERVLKRTG